MNRIQRTLSKHFKYFLSAKNINIFKVNFTKKLERVGRSTLCNEFTVIFSFILKEKLKILLGAISGEGI